MAHRLFIKERVLTPGPVEVPPAVLLEMAQPIIHHRTKQFQVIFEEVSKRLQRVFRTAHPVLSIAGSGTTAFEAAQASLTPPGSKAIVVAGGKFGERWQDIYDQYGITQVKVNVPWGQAVTAAQIEEALKANPDASIVALCHSETSTATACDIQAIAKVVSKSNALLLVDGITAVGAMPVEMDAWGIDCLVTGSQKAMMLPPGLGYVGLGPRALARLKATKAGPFYNLDLRRWLKAYDKNDVPFTPPVSLIRGQRVALEMMENEGMENIWARSAKLAAASRAAFSAMGLKLISESPSDSVTGAFYPTLNGEVVDDKTFRAAMRNNHGLHLAGGQDGRGANWAKTVFRISHMGYVDAGDTLAALVGIEKQFKDMGAKITHETAIPAALKVLLG